MTGATRGPIGVSQMKKIRERIDEFVLLALAILGAIGMVGTVGFFTVAGLIKIYGYLFG